MEWQHLTKRTKRLVTLGVLVVVCAVGGFVAWNWGSDLYADAEDFMTFPELKTRAFFPPEGARQFHARAQAGALTCAFTFQPQRSTSRAPS